MKKGFRILKFKKDKEIFSVRDVTKSFDGRPILKKISFKVFPGECVGILGPNGCGKTTLFSMCIGEQSVDNGKIFLNNKLRKKVWFVAPIISSIFGSITDTFLFFSIAFYSTGIPWVTLAIGDLAVKFLIAILMLVPFRLLLRRFKPA